MPEKRKCAAGHEYWWPGQKWHHEDCVANVKPVANEPVANKSMEWLRVKVWREANRERYNARQRELMRKKRKEKRDEERTVSGGHADVEPR